MTFDVAATLSTFPRAAIDYDNAAFYGGLIDHQFLVNRCADCGFWHLPPRPVCPKCWSKQVVPTPIGGGGELYMIVWLHQGAPPGGDPGIPYPLATVELDEQPALRMTTMLTGCTKEEMRIGMRVELAWVERDGAPYPVFRPAAGPDATRPAEPGSAVPSTGAGR